jgi:hypothetical protein
MLDRIAEVLMLGWAVFVLGQVAITHRRRAPRPIRRRRGRYW